MCERVLQSYDIPQLLRIANTHLIHNSEKYKPSYNIGPANYLPIIRYKESITDNNNNREVNILKWGFETRFQQLVINAKIEDVLLKKAFQPLINTRRCAVIVEGYYQWNSQKEPWVFRPKKKDSAQEAQILHLLLAGVYAMDDSVILLTRESTSEFKAISNQMPVLLDQRELDMWIDCQRYKYDESLQGKILDLKNEKWKSMFYYQVAPYINDIKNTTVKVLTKIEEYKEGVKTDGLLKFFSPCKSSKNKGEFQDSKEKEKNNRVQKTPGTNEKRKEEKETKKIERKEDEKEIQKNEEKDKNKDSNQKEHKNEVLGLKKEADNEKESIVRKVVITKKNKYQPIKVEIKEVSEKKAPGILDNEEATDVSETEESKREGIHSKLEANSKVNNELSSAVKTLHKALDGVDLGVQKGFEVKEVVIVVEKKNEKVTSREQRPKSDSFLEGTKKRKDFEGKNEEGKPQELKQVKRQSLNPFLFKKV